MSNYKMQVTLSGDTVDEIVAALDAVRAELVAPRENPVVVTDAAPKKTPAIAPKSAPKVEAKAEKKESPELHFDYDIDVIPRVLKAVEVCGKQFVADTLAKYGAKKASEVSPTWMPEFLARLDEAVDGAR